MQNLRHPKKFDKGIVRFEKKLRSSRREAYLHTLRRENGGRKSAVNLGK